jgi:hypothetical protein
LHWANKGLSQPGYEHLGLVHDLAPRDSNDTQAGCDKVCVAAPVAFEFALGGVKRPAIDFYNESLGAPHEIHSMARYSDIRLDAGEGGLPDELEESLLRLRSAERNGRLFLKQSTKPRCTATPRIAVEERENPGTLSQSQRKRLAH